MGVDLSNDEGYYRQWTTVQMGVYLSNDQGSECPRCGIRGFGNICKHKKVSYYEGFHATETLSMCRSNRLDPPKGRRNQNDFVKYGRTRLCHLQLGLGSSFLQATHPLDLSNWRAVKRSWPWYFGQCPKNYGSREAVSYKAFRGIWNHELAHSLQAFSINDE